MTTELTMLAYAALLQVAQWAIYSLAANIQVGLKHTAGSRDEAFELTGVAGRLQRAFDNHFGALILFTIAVIVVVLSEQSTQFTQNCAILFVVARILYVPAYVSGIFMVRSLVWMVALGATVAMLVAALV